MRKLIALISVAVAVVYGRQPERARRAMIASADAHATSAGIRVLEAGGNAIDAAVATSFALAVTHPGMSGLGGGGMMVIRFADGRSAFVDFREKAPARASRNMFLDKTGNATEESVLGWRAAGVPGQVSGLAYVHGKYGRRPWAELVRPAVDLAKGGFALTWSRAQILRTNVKVLDRSPESRRIFLNDAKLFESGDTLRQPELAATLQRIADRGAADFYEGETARRLVAASQANGGLFTLEDLKAYAPVECPPVRGLYRGIEVLSAANSSAGGIGLVQMLAILEGTGFEKHGAGSAAAMHWMTEAMRRYYAARSEYFGDPALVRVPIRGLLDRRFIDALRGTIDPERATPSERVKPGNPNDYESSETTHFSIVDAEGNAVALTQTINSGFGSGVTVPGLGFLLNNNMDNFAPKPGSGNRYGLIQGEANAIQPGKRPVSSMTPSILVKDGKLFMVVGTPGGPSIPTAVLQAVVNVIDFGMNAQEALDAPRIHHQWYPDRIQAERGISPDTIALLRARGHAVEVTDSRNDMMAIVVRDGWLEGAADSRREGKASGY